MIRDVKSKLPDNAATTRTMNYILEKADFAYLPFSSIDILSLLFGFPFHDTLPVTLDVFHSVLL